MDIESQLQSQPPLERRGCHALQELAQTEKRWTIHPRMEEMKALARAQGLWNLWISTHLAACMAEVAPGSEDRALLGAGLSNLVSHRRSPRRRTLQALPNAQSAGVADCRYLVTEQAGCGLSAP